MRGCASCGGGPCRWEDQAERHAQASAPEPQAVVVHVTTEPPPPPTLHPCQVGRHRPAWLASGGMACGYCGKPL